MSSQTAISPTRAKDYPQWYQQVIKHAELAENSAVRGCMVIKPWGYRLWENIQGSLDKKFKATGHENIYCPLFIPKSYLEREAEHVDGFATECAVVTHHRLVKNTEGQLDVASPLEEPLIIRPTSETVIGELFANWMQSYRDLPIKVNQWANVVRWEMRPRIFLRTSEFLWQEGHTAHATQEEAETEAREMLDVYADFAQDMLAIPVIKGEKTESERFPGALNTLCIEAMMQDGKALQAGTSHFLGQNFAKAFDMKYLDQEGQQQLAWTTSWGVSTRLIGALIMTHSDDDGLVLPPRIAGAQVVILPLTRKGQDNAKTIAYCQKIKSQLEEINYHGKNLEVIIDLKDDRPGNKAWSWVKKGVPLRLEIGGREEADSKICYSRRDKGYKEKNIVPQADFIGSVTDVLDQMQQAYFDKALTYQKQKTVRVDTESDFMAAFQKHDAGFVIAFYAEENTVNKRLKTELSVTPRCIPFDTQQENGTCIFTGKPGKLTVFAKAY